MATDPVSPTLARNASSRRLRASAPSPPAVVLWRSRRSISTRWITGIALGRGCRRGFDQIDAPWLSSSPERKIATPYEPSDDLGSIGLPSAPRVERREIGGRAARLGCLLEGVCQTQQDGLAPGAAGEGCTIGIVRRVLVAHPGDKACGNLDARIAGLGGDRRNRGAGEQHRVEPVAVHIGVET